MALALRDEVNDYLATGPLPACPWVRVTSSPRGWEEAALEEYTKKLLEGFVNWLFDNEKLGVFKR